MIGPAEFTDFVQNCDLLGFFHTRYHSEFVPEHLKPSEYEEQAFRQNGPFGSEAEKRYMRKIGNRSRHCLEMLLSKTRRDKILRI